MKDEVTTLNDEKLKKAILKRALGYDAKEVVEEYSQTKDGEIVLTKKKVTVKNVPPDVSALKIMLDTLSDEELIGLTDEQLNEEMERLLNLLQTKIEEKEEKKQCKKVQKPKEQKSKS